MNMQNTTESTRGSGSLDQLVRVHPYARLRRAFKRRTGMNLSADDVQRLMLGDTALYDAVMETWKDEP